MKWTIDEENILRERYEAMTDDELAILLRKTPGAIKCRRNVLRLCRDRRYVANRVPVKVKSRQCLDCMDWPYPFVKPKEKQL